MANPYEILGLSASATPEEIRRAYRKLAKKYHPDLNPGKAEAEQRFKDITAAYTLLSDPDRRARFDRGEIDASGQETPQRPFYRGFAEGPGGARYTEERFAHPEDLESFFADLFGGRGEEGAREGGFRVRARGADAGYTLTVDFLEAVRGARRRITLPEGRTLEVDLPAGLEDGQTIRLRGQGMPGLGGGPPGDALVRVDIAPHPFFRRDGADVHVELPVTLAEAVLGGKVRVPTIDGPVMLTIPRGANSGTVLRLKGKGLSAQAGARGDQYVVLRVALPETPDPELEDFVRRWSESHPYNPRRSLETA